MNALWIILTTFGCAVLGAWAGSAMVKGPDDFGFGTVMYGMAGLIGGGAAGVILGAILFA